MTPPIPAHEVMPPEAMHHASDARPAASVPARETRQAGRVSPDQETDEERMRRLDKLWIPLPCTRVGMRMVC